MKTPEQFENPSCQEFLFLILCHSRHSPSKTDQMKGRNMEENPTIKQARDVLKIEAESILELIDKIGDNFVRAVNIIYKSKGRVIVTGIGKSGLIGKKIVATLTSTGTHAIFLHPVEGMHGDLGIVTKDDVMLAISNSGETNELNMILSSVEHDSQQCA